MMPNRFGIAIAVLAIHAGSSPADELPKIKNVELQPLAAQAKRVADALEFLGSPLAEAERQALAKASDAVGVQNVLDKHCLAGVRVSDDKPPRIETVPGPAKPELAEQGWRVFLVKVENPG